jgi:hypothetical protein
MSISYAYFVHIYAIIYIPSTYFLLHLCKYMQRVTRYAYVMQVCALMYIPFQLLCIYTIHGIHKDKYMAYTELHLHMHKDGTAKK